MTALKVPSALPAMLAFLVFGSVLAPAANAQDQAERIRAHMNAPDRSADDQQRDQVRKPIEVMEFLGVEDGMTALDVIAAGGWYTGVLSAAVGPTGKVYSQNPAFFLSREGFAEAEAERHAALGNVEALHGDIEGIDGEIDVAISNQNIHDLYNSGGDEAALQLLRSIYAALKPGGVFGLMDHRGTAGADNGALHRMPTEAARELLEEAGFVVEAESDLLSNPADDHTKGPGDESLGGNSDRFLLKARKPG